MLVDCCVCYHMTCDWADDDTGWLLCHTPATARSNARPSSSDANCRPSPVVCEDNSEQSQVSDVVWVWCGCGGCGVECLCLLWQQKSSAAVKSCEDLGTIFFIFAPQHIHVFGLTTNLQGELCFVSKSSGAKLTDVWTVCVLQKLWNYIEKKEVDQEQSSSAFVLFVVSFSFFCRFINVGWR